MSGSSHKESIACYSHVQILDSYTAVMVGDPTSTETYE